MLVDIPMERLEAVAVERGIKEGDFFWQAFEREQFGVYSSLALDFYLGLADMSFEHFPQLTEDPYDEKSSSYGVSDDVEQILEYHKEIIDNPDRQFVINVTAVHKSNEPERDGWRWHKWGPYIGTKNPQCEYIADEDDSIESVVLWHVFEITGI